ncbi:purine-nucleoside phosphorylase [Intestinimonas butyriciproducens]|uniref:purine-nucleoside phosphorylase n=1 Tax=Intestinimonas butyriciproducens TaxID=1297617 RepID=UPI0018AC2986|nr:purine-nucleoside phosphorylase [Intestinimonas butyriciproducens]MDB7817242.1 purine-nucleoside phosphorylase [Intestinimonas butyriciproducens]MDB7843786.1 purine-nucleoside phosphorylase [Intestinimonas butyriciproducens]MDB7858267.1 purine-nucleoside phosphorylase [Intestinimonas butyriciproducens]
MQYTFAQYQESADFIRAKIGSFAPKVAMVLGSGLGFLGDEVEDPICVSYRDIPHFKASTAPGHKGRLVFGTLRGRNVAVMQGRMHHYEGYSYEEVSYAVRVLRLLGCDTLVVTNAAGGVNLDFQAGDLMLITDHIKIFMESPLRGENLPAFGPRFPDASHLYTPALQEVARTAARDLGIPLREGVYMYFPGPQYETPAEVRFARVAGADAVGMSTAPEVIVAGHCGMQVLGFTLVSNLAAGILDQPLSEQEVLDAAEACKDKFSRLVLACLERI